MREGRGTGTWVVAYNSATNTCYQLHTDTGVVTRWSCVGGSGPSCAGGAWTGTDIANTTGDRITVHNAKTSKGGDWIEITPTACLSSANSCGNGFTNVYFWQTGTATWNDCPALTCGGHVTEGFSHLMNNGGPPFRAVDQPHLCQSKLHDAAGQPNDLHMREQWKHGAMHARRSGHTSFLELQPWERLDTGFYFKLWADTAFSWTLV
jgi:hypothetical protein